MVGIFLYSLCLFSFYNFCKGFGEILKIVEFKFFVEIFNQA